MLMCVCVCGFRARIHAFFIVNNPLVLTRVYFPPSVGVRGGLFPEQLN